MLMAFQPPDLSLYEPFYKLNCYSFYKAFINSAVQLGYYKLFCCSEGGLTHTHTIS